MRDEITPTSYTEWWLKYAWKELADDPASVLHHFTHPNYSGGVSGWEDFINDIYYSPSTPQEQYLKAQVHEVLLIAQENAFKRAEAMRDGRKWSAFAGMDLAEAYRLSHMIARTNPLNASAVKVRLNAIAVRMGKTLYELAECNFSAFMGPAGIKW